MYQLWQQIKWIIFLLCLLGTVIFCLSCSPQKRLNRLIKNHPELADTVYSVTTVTVPGLSIDTFFVHSIDTLKIEQNLDSILSKYLFAIDSLTARELSGKLKNYIIERPCLNDTLTIELHGRGKVKVWQQGKIFKGQAILNAQQVSVKSPTVQFTYSNKNHWPWLGAGILIGWFVLFIVLGLLAKVKPKN